MPAASSTQQLLQQVDDSITEDFVALLVARNRCGPNIDIYELLHRNAVPPAVFERLLAAPTFVSTVKRYMAELTASGFGVQSKAAVLHEAGLPIVYEILGDRAQPALARLKAHEILGAVSGKGETPTQTVNLNAAGGGSYQLVINLGSTQPSQTLTAPPTGLMRSEVAKLVTEAADVEVVDPVELIDPDYA
jgi:hypothetical protein